MAENPDKDIEDKSLNEVHLDDIIDKANKTTVASELEVILANVKPGCGNCTSRRKLRRLLENLMKNDEFQKQLNAKSRRKYQRWLLVLKPDPNGHVLEVKKKDDMKTLIIEQKPVKPISSTPCVAFLGQLSFDTTSNEIEEHFRSNGVIGDIKIRILTYPETKLSRGTAFVEFEGPKELRKALNLHHSYLNGRRINIEKSCGGKNKETRETRLETLRQEQMERDKLIMDNILKEYNDKEVISLEDLSETMISSLYLATPLAVREVESL